MGADEAKSLRSMRSDVAGIEQVAETTSPVMEIPSPDDKVFAKFEGRLVPLTRDQTCCAIRLVKGLPCSYSIRRLGKEEAYNLGFDELLPFDENFWLFSIIEKGPDPENSRRLIGYNNPWKSLAETVVTDEVMEIPSPDDKVFAEFQGHLVPLDWDETCRALRCVKVSPRSCSIRRLGKEEAYTLGPDELLASNENCWLFSIIEKGPDLLAKPLWERNAGKEDHGHGTILHKLQDALGKDRGHGTANSKTNRLPTRSRKDLKKAKVEQKALKRILRESSGVVYGILTDKFPLLCANRENLLPVYSKDSESAHEVLTFKAFLGSAFNVPPKQAIGMLVFLFTLLQYVTKNSIDTPPSQFDGVLNFGEAIFALTPQIADTTLFIISYIMAWVLVLPLKPPGLLIFLGVILIFAPFLLLLYMVRYSSASDIHVTCGSFNMSDIAFTSIFTIAFCIIFAAFALTVLYAIWCFMYRMKPATGQNFEVTTADLMSQMSEELNANDDNV